MDRTSFPGLSMNRQAEWGRECVTPNHCREKEHNSIYLKYCEHMDVNCVSPGSSCFLPACSLHLCEMGWGLWLSAAADWGVPEQMPSKFWSFLSLLLIHGFPGLCIKWGSQVLGYQAEWKEGGTRREQAVRGCIARDRQACTKVAPALTLCMYMAPSSLSSRN